MTKVAVIAAILVFQRLTMIYGLGQSMMGDSETVTMSESMSVGMMSMSVESMVDTISVSEPPLTSTAGIVPTTALTELPRMTATATAMVGSPVVTTTATASIPSSSAFIPGTGDGPEVLITITVKTECNETTLNKNGSMYESLKGNITHYLFLIYHNCNLKAIVLVSFTCKDNNNVDALVRITFGTSFPTGKYTKTELEKEIAGGNLGSLAVDTTVAVSFVGASISYEPKSGQCQNVCCEGAGGPIELERKCKPDNKCAGLEPSTKQEVNHCDGSEGALCPMCDGSNVLSSLAVLTFASSFLRLLM